MASNNLQDLNDMMFNQLCRLDKDNISDEELQKEINRSNAMNKIASTIVNNAQVVLEASKFMDNRNDANAELPRMLGESNSDQKELEHHEK